MDIKELKGHFDQAASEMTALVTRQSEEIKKYGETTEATGKRIADLGKTIDDMQGDVKSFDERLQATEKKMNHPGYTQTAQTKSLGQMFVDSEEFKSAQARGLRHTGSVNLEGSFFRKDISNATASAGNIIDALRLPEIYRQSGGDREVHIRDFMNVGQTSEGSIEYMVDDNASPPQAAPQYNSQSGATELVAKKSSNWTFDLVTVPVRTLAHFVVASRQILNDVPRLRSYVDNQLRYGLALEEDAQILYGTGTGGDLTGIMTNTAIQNAGGVASGDTILDHLRKAIALGRVAEYAMNGMLLHPTDWSNIELLKGNDDHYLWVTVPNGGEPRLWRVPVYETTAINAGDFLVGNWTLAAQLLDREQTTLRIAEQHDDLFVKNGVVILAEERVALTVFRPKAFVKGSFDPAST
jgi:HK97 family phage major capsid protein